jgi:hypothetical protein
MAALIHGGSRFRHDDCQSPFLVSFESNDSLVDESFGVKQLENLR